MAEKITLKNALANLPQKTDVDSIVAKDASGNPVYIKKADLAQVVAELIGTVTTEKDGLWPASKAFYNDFSSLKVATFKPLSSACFILYTINPFNYGFAALIDFNFGETMIFAKYKVLYGNATTMSNLKIGYTNNNDEVILYISRPSVTFNIICLGKSDEVKLEYIKTPDIPSNLTVLDKYD